MKNKFDTVMDYIDAHIQEDIEIIKRGIYNEIGYNSSHFGKCFEVLTGETLFHYISERRLYFAGQELKHNLTKPICDIALDLGYSEQSAFTRAMRTYHDCTPNEVRKGTSHISDKKYELSHFSSNKPESRADIFWQELETNGFLTGKKFDYLMELEKATEEYGFHIDTCYAIADVAEQLEIPVGLLLNQCFQLMVDVQSNPNYIPPDIEVAIDAGVSSSEEMDQICGYYGCKYYDVDRFMVEAFRNVEQSQNSIGYTGRNL